MSRLLLYIGDALSAPLRFMPASSLRSSSASRVMTSTAASRIEEMSSQTFTLESGVVVSSSVLSSPEEEDTVSSLAEKLI